ncbi:hypothetical protein [Blastochloris sulfoviridis]|uniref:hypothetical protein n=1 Tax=Blastochloris sulfoviridis TaxID=50712 RepID=UPI001FE92A27|nr:hypothetical protein [Blastochloris sulfoviridis]
MAAGLDQLRNMVERHAPKDVVHRRVGLGTKLVEGRQHHAAVRPAGLEARIGRLGERGRPAPQQAPPGDGAERRLVRGVIGQIIGRGGGRSWVGATCEADLVPGVHDVAVDASPECGRKASRYGRRDGCLLDGRSFLADRLARQRPLARRAVVEVVAEQLGDLPI